MGVARPVATLLAMVFPDARLTLISICPVCLESVSGLTRELTGSQCSTQVTCGNHHEV